MSSVPQTPYGIVDIQWKTRVTFQPADYTVSDADKNAATYMYEQIIRK